MHSHLGALSPTRWDTEEEQTIATAHDLFTSGPATTSGSDRQVKDLANPKLLITFKGKIRVVWSLCDKLEGPLKWSINPWLFWVQFAASYLELHHVVLGTLMLVFKIRTIPLPARSCKDVSKANPANSDWQKQLWVQRATYQVTLHTYREVLVLIIRVSHLSLRWTRMNCPPERASKRWIAHNHHLLQLWFGSTTSLIHKFPFCQAK